jgi:CheY-like chemotaxis protein
VKISCHGVKVLLVDDDPQSRVPLAELLESRGAQVRSAASVSEGLKAYVQDKPDILLSDIAMPEEDGYSLIRQIRKLGEDLGKIPAIALSGYASNESRTEALAAGFDAHLAKPVDIDALEKKIVELVG